MYEQKVAFNAESDKVASDALALTSFLRVPVMLLDEWNGVSPLKRQSSLYTTNTPLFWCMDHGTKQPIRPEGHAHCRP